MPKPISHVVRRPGPRPGDPDVEIPVAEDLVRGWLSFRIEDEKHDTAPVIMEETVELVIERAVEFPEPMLQQLFGSARR